MKKQSKILKFLFLATFAFLALGQLQRFELGNSVAFYAHDLTITAIVIYVFLTSGITFKPSRQALVFWPVTFSLFALATLLFNHQQFGSLSGLFYWSRWTIHALLFPATYLAITRHKLSISIYKALIGVALFIAVLGILQFIFIPDTRFLYYFGWDDHLNRLISTLFDPGFTGLLLLLGLILVETSKKPNNFVYACLFAALILTYSRATYLATAAVFLAISARRKSLKYFITRMLLISLAIAILPQADGEGAKLTRTQSVQSRLESTQKALTASTKHKIVGIGFNNFRSLNDTKTSLPSHSSAPDNSYIFLFLTTGFVGFAIYLFWLLKTTLWSYQHSPQLLATIAALSVHALANNSLFYPFATIWFWLLLGSQLAKHQRE